MIVIAVLAVIIIGVVVTLNFVPARLEKSMNKVQEHPPYDISPAALKMHDGLTIMDWHSDSLLWKRNLLERADYGHVDIPRLIEGNVAIQMFTAVTKSPRGQNYEENAADSDNITLLAMIQLWPHATWSSLFERALYQARKLHEYASKNSDLLIIVRNRSQLKQALAARAEAKNNGTAKPVMALLGIEGAHALEGDLDNIQALYDAGYRMIGPHHFFDNKLGGSLHGVSQSGLTEFGRQVIQELDRMQIIIDVAHASPAVVDDILQITTRPLVVSHTGIYGACRSKRNIPDEHMLRIAEKGGLIGIGYWEGAVCDISPDGVVETLRYAIDLLGEDHVALGSDFDGTTTTAFDTSELAILTQKMMDNGFTDSEITKVMGANSVKFLLSYLSES